MMAHRAPSSSSITYKWTYDVFLSFYGDDTRLGFISFLYQSLRQRGIHAFLDDEFIRTGEKITPALFRAIEESRIAIIVFSANYANSTFCLQELEKILECFKEESRLIYPVFYYVDPSELRRPRGSYAKALAQQEERFKDNREKVEKWRQALSQAADLKGCHLRPKNGNEQECITRITNEVATRINQEHLYVTNHPVGLVSRVKEVISCLDLWSTKEVKMIGIWGAGGIGKSTIGRAVYNSISDNFEALCFLSNVRNQSNMPNGLSHLQETLLCKLVMEKDLKLGDYHDGIPIIEHRLSQKKILLVLDDVDESDQLEALAGNCNWFGCGSRIIITTRNKQLLQSHGIESIYDVRELNGEESLKLLSWYAFKKENMDFNYVEVCNRAVDYSCGFPLALEVIGSNLSGKGVNIWSSALDQFQSIPNERVLDALKLSYDTLGEVEKQVFLDLACFFNGEKLANVIHILLCVREIQPKYAIDTLIDKSLIKIEQDLVRMHDLIEDVGKEIVRQQSPFEPGERSRLWFYQDILDVLQQDTGTNKVEAIVLDSPESIEVQWGGEEFMKMKNLKMLVIRRACFSECPKYLPNSLRWLEWKVYPFKFLPYHVRPTKLVYLDLSYSYCESLQPFDKKFSNLNHMNLRNCKFLQQIPNLSGASNLTELWLDDCTNLIEIHDSVGYLKKLRELSAMRCKNLKILPSCLRLTSLKHLNLFGCLSLQRFPEISVMMEEMQTLDLDKTAIAELPSSICNLIGLEILNVMDCPNLKQLPASIWTLPNLRKLRANFCKGMSNIRICEGGDEASLDCSAMPTKMEHLCLSSCNLSDDFVALCLPNFTNMIHLNLSFSNFTVLPECIKEYHNLKYLLLDNCNQLEHIGEMPPNLEKFSAICCTSLTKLSKSKVLKQAFNFQHGKRDFILPGKSLPERLHHYSRGSSVSFWVRNVSPTIFLWILVKDDQDYVDNCKLLVHINDTKVAISTIKTDHVYICAMQSIIHSTKLPPGDTLNQVTVSIRSKPPNMGDRKEFYFGVRIYNLQSNLGNIQFMDPCRYIIDFNLFQKNQEQEDRKELEEDMDWDLDSTKSAESPMHYQGGSSSWVSGVTNGLSGVERVLPGSKCLVVQELLDEVVNLIDGIKKSSSETKVIKESSLAAREDGAGGEGSAKPSSELSTSEKQDTQMKKAELISMLDEVQQRYVQYRHEMQTMISLFEQAAGIGSARAYTASPLAAISRHFRILKDAIMGQIEAANKSLLGEEDSFASKMEGSRLKYVNHQLRQERSVSVLRSWLLEHFLHPYPSDSDEHMLAKQTGFTTGQVSNWFINARVRLWKPMVEEMSLEEMEEQEQNGGKEKSCKSISEDPAIKSALNFKQDIPRNPNAPTVSVSTPSTSPVGGNARNHPGFSFMGTSELDDDIAQPSPKKPRNHE